MALCRQVDGLEILVSTLRSQTFCPAVFTKHGIDVTQYRLVGLKSSSHFRAGFRDVASEIITCDAMGLTTKRPVSPAPPASLHLMHKGTKARCFCGLLNPPLLLWVRHSRLKRSRGCAGDVRPPPRNAADVAGGNDPHSTFSWLAMIAQMISEMRRANRRRTHCRPSSRSLPRLSSRAAGSDRPLHSG